MSILTYAQNTAPQNHPKHTKKFFFRPMRRATKKIITAAESLFERSLIETRADSSPPPQATASSPPPAPPAAPPPLIPRQYSPQPTERREERFNHVPAAFATPPQATAAPCPACGNPIFWTDPADDPHCLGCDPPPYPEAIRARFIVIDVSPETDGSLTEWEEMTLPQ